MRSRDGLTEALLNVGNSIHQHKKHHPEASNSTAHTPPVLQGSARTQLGEQPEADARHNIQREVQAAARGSLSQSQQRVLTTPEHKAASVCQSTDVTGPAPFPPHDEDDQATGPPGTPADVSTSRPQAGVLVGPLDGPRVGSQDDALARPQVRPARPLGGVTDQSEEDYNAAIIGAAASIQNKLSDA
jgi:hypothetical protein